MKKLFLFLLVVAVAAGSYKVGYDRGERHAAEHMVLIDSLSKISLITTHLSLVDQNRGAQAKKELERQLASALESAERYGDTKIKEAMPNLVDSLRRGKNYAERVGNGELSKRFDKLHAKLKAMQEKYVK